MKKILRSLFLFLKLFGINPFVLLNNIKGFPYFIRDYKNIRHQILKAKLNKSFINIKFNPFLNERFKQSGTMSGHYFHQDLFIARKIYQRNPEKHVDIGSRIDGFIAHLATFREVEVFDIRANDNSVENIVFKQADVCSNNFDLINYSDSISSLHAIEHFGLGRYGDEVDINAHIKGLDNIYKALKKNGFFYFSVPIGKMRIEFNAHRVFSISYLLDLIKEKYKIHSISYVDDLGNLMTNITLTESIIDSNLSCNFGCIIFELIKV